MLTKPDSPKGPQWMLRLADWLGSMNRSERRFRLFWVWIGAAVFAMLGASFAISAAPAQTYESSTNFNGLPLLSYGVHAHGVIAVGETATGGIAIGNVAFGVVAIGGFAVGGISLGGVSVGLLALGGLAAGNFALGGLAVGYAAVGGFALGGHAYAGNGVAVGLYSASGKQHEHVLGLPNG